MPFPDLFLCLQELLVLPSFVIFSKIGVGCNSNFFLHEGSDVFNSDVAILLLDDIINNFTPLLPYPVGQPFNDFPQGIRVLKFA